VIFLTMARSTARGKTSSHPFADRMPFPSFCDWDPAMPAPSVFMRVIFTGTGDIGLPLLSALLKEPTVTLAAVICQPDKPVGRKQILTPPATKTAALAAGLPVLQPERIRQIPDAIAALEPDLMMVMAYGQILPSSILGIPRLGCINLHASLLPRHRGASPIQSAILAGDPESGITVMQMDAGLDTGAILHQQAIPLGSGETGGSLHDRLAELTPGALLAILPAIANGSAVPRPQDARLATHCGKLTRHDGEIDWNQPAHELERRIRAFDPWPGTTTTLPDGSRAKLFPPVDCDPHSTGCPLPGTILHAGSDGIRIACGSGSLTIHELQLDGRRRLPVSAFLSGHPIGTGARMNSAPPPLPSTHA
jgi:methionyl-tRNA formyltransferase